MNLNCLLIILFIFHLLFTRISFWIQIVFWSPIVLIASSVHSILHSDLSGSTVPSHWPLRVYSSSTLTSQGLQFLPLLVHRPTNFPSWTPTWVQLKTQLSFTVFSRLLYSTCPSRTCPDVSAVLTYGGYFDCSLFFVRCSLSIDAPWRMTSAQHWTCAEARTPLVHCSLFFDALHVRLLFIVHCSLMRCDEWRQPDPCRALKHVRLVRTFTKANPYTLPSLNKGLSLIRDLAPHTLPSLDKGLSQSVL